MSRIVLYIHGQGGNAGEAEHYAPLFANCRVVGLAYSARTPWEACAEFPRLFEEICRPSDSVILIANSIGAYFAMQTLPQNRIEKAYFISPVVNMERMIETMMCWAHVTEDTLRKEGTIETDFGQTLSWEYLCYARTHRVRWIIPTHILYGAKDALIPHEAVSEFAGRTGAALTVMEQGEHWFHTPEQMAFLDQWIRAAQEGK